MCRLITDKQAKEIIKDILAKGADNAQYVYDNFIKFTNKYHLDISRQVISQNRNGKYICNCLLIINPGASGNIILTELNEATIAQLRFLARQIENFDIGFLQSIIDETDTGKEKILSQAGFRRLCLLEIMELESNFNKFNIPVNDEEALAVNWLTFNNNLQDEFENTIIASYKDSMDCPEITGLRSKQEILIGHKYSGNFTPQFWLMLKYKKQNAGIILLNEAVEEPQRLDLIYMGIVPEFRGKGLGKILLSHAIKLAENSKIRKIRLAVDSRNIPAIRLYHKIGFSTIQRQIVFAVLNENRRMKNKRNDR